MASPLLSRTPSCISCLHRISLYSDIVSYPPRQAIRGKKFVAKAPPSIKVQLLQSIPGYGRKGSIVPITPGVMRNIWYPRKMATYVTMSKLQELGGRNIAVERDPVFGTNKERKVAERQRREAKSATAISVEQTAAEGDLNSQSIAEKNIGFVLPLMTEAPAPPLAAEESKEAVSVTLSAQSFPPLAAEESKEPVSVTLSEHSSPPSELLEAARTTPEQATGILSELLPQYITIFREPIAASAPAKPEKPVKIVSSSLSSGAARSTAARTQATKTSTKKKAEKSRIDGSVTKIDIEAAIKAILAEHDEGRDILFSSKNVTLRDETADNEGIQSLGTWEINIRLDGSPGVIQRFIKVVTQAGGDI